MASQEDEVVGLELCSHQKACWGPCPLVPVNVTLFGREDFADVIKTRFG